MVTVVVDRALKLARPDTLSAPVPEIVPKLLKVRLCAGAALLTVIVPLFRLLMVTSSVAVGTAAQDHLAASCQLPLPPSQLQAAAWAGASDRDSAAVRKRRKAEQVGTERLSHEVCGA